MAVAVTSAARPYWEEDKMDEDLLQICNKTVELGERLGADEIEAFSGYQRIIETLIDGNEIKMTIGGESSGIGIRIFRNHSLGFAFSNSLEEEKIETAVRSAIALSKNAPPDIYNRLPNPKRFGFVAGLFDNSIEEFQEPDVIDRASRMLEAAKGIDDRVSVDSGRFEVDIGMRAISNSLGIEADERYSGIFCDIGAHGVENGKISSADYRFDGARTLREDRSEELSVELAEAVVESLSAKKIESFVGQAVISPYAAVEILTAPILFCVDSNNVQKGISRFANRKGEHVASPVLSVIDDGTVPAGLSSSAFDREGIPHVPIKIIDGGRLRNFLHDTYTANKEGIESTGHATGGARHVPSIDSTNIYVKKGNRSLEDIISTVERGIFVHRFSGSIDPISGDFSGVAKASKEITRGTLSGAVRETMISGNVYDIISRLIDVSSDTVKVMDYRLPYFLADEVSITSG